MSGLEFSPDASCPPLDPADFPGEAAILALAVDPGMGGVCLDEPSARFDRLASRLASWLDPAERPLPLPSTLAVTDLEREESIPGWERSSLSARIRDRIVVLMHPERCDAEVRAVLLRARGHGVLANFHRRGSAPPSWPVLFPRATPEPEGARVLRELLEEEVGPDRRSAIAAARLRREHVAFPEIAWETLARVSPRLSAGTLGSGDAGLHRAARWLVSWSALAGRDEVGVDLVESLCDLFGVEEVSPEVAPPTVPPSIEPNRTGRDRTEDRGELVAIEPIELPAPLTGPTAGRRVSRGTGRGGPVVRYAPAGRRRTRIDAGATLRRAAPRQRLRGVAPGQRPVVELDDLRVAIHRERRGDLHLVVLDASGSMGGEAIRIARGAALALLERAYQTRESVGLIVVGGGRAHVAVAPMRAPERLRRAVLAPRVGGGTPLAGALSVAQRLLRRIGDAGRVWLVTDGRANLTLDGRRDRERAGEEVGIALEGLAAFGARVAVLGRPYDRRARDFAKTHRLEWRPVDPLGSAR